MLLLSSSPPHEERQPGYDENQGDNRHNNASDGANAYGTGRYGL